jgi:large repetitive protein
MKNRKHHDIGIADRHDAWRSDLLWVRWKSPRHKNRAVAAIAQAALFFLRPLGAALGGVAQALLPVLLGKWLISARRQECLRHLVLFPLALMFIAPLGLAAQTLLQFAGAQSTVASGLIVPVGVAVDGAGDVFIAESTNPGSVVKVSPGGATTTLASGLGFGAEFAGLAADGAGDVFIAQTGSGSVVKVSPGGVTTTVASNLSEPTGVTVDAKGDVFIAEQAPGGAQVVELPWTGSAYGNPISVASGLSHPEGVAVDAKGDVFVADRVLDEVFEAPLTAAGYVGQSAVVSGLRDPWGVAVDGAGDLFIAEAADNPSVNQVVEVPPGCTSASCQTTVGSGLSSPFAVAVDSASDVFITDSGNNRVVELSPFAVNFWGVSIGTTSQTATLSYNVVASNETSPNVLTQGAPNLDFTLAGGSTCTGAVVEASQCTVNVTFAPKTPGLRMGAVQLTDSFGNVPTTMLRGIGQGPAIAFGPGAQTTVASGLSYPEGVAVDGKGDVFIANHEGGSVLEVPAGCTNTTCQTTLATGLVGPEGVAVDGAGDLFIAATGNSSVMELPWTGTGYGSATTVVGGLLAPNDVAVDGAGDLFIVLARIIHVFLETRKASGAINML